MTVGSALGLKTFGKNAFLGSASSIIITATPFSCVFIIHKVSKSSLILAALGLCLSVVLNKKGSFPLIKLASRRLQADVPAVQMGGYIGATLAMSAFLCQKSLGQFSSLVFYSSFLFGGLLAGTLALNKQIAKVKRENYVNS